MFQCKIPIGVLGLGMSHGRQCLSNAELIKRFDLNITPKEMENKTGIQTRYFLDEAQALSDIAAEAADNALRNANISPDKLSRIILATSTPDYLSPSTACVVQYKLGASGFPCHDVSAACSGFLYAIDQALRYLHTGDDLILVIGADARSRTLSRNDINTIGLYGDGAGALVLGSVNHLENQGFVSSFTYADGSGYEAVAVPSVGHAQQEQQRLNRLSMPSGSKVMKNAIKAMPLVCNKVLNHNDLTLDDVDWFVFHQPNLMLLHSIAKRMGIPTQKVATSFCQFGNTVAASIPITLMQAYKSRKIQRDDLVLLASIGAGFTSAATLIKWNLS